MGIKDVLTKNFQSDTQLKKRVKDIIYVRAGECKLCKLTETVQKN